MGVLYSRIWSSNLPHLEFQFFSGEQSGESPFCTDPVLQHFCSAHITNTFLNVISYLEESASLGLRGSGH